MIEPAEHAQVLASGQVLVDGGVLAGETDRAAYFIGLLDDVESCNSRATCSGCKQGRQDAHRGGLAGAVGAKEAHHLATLNSEVNAIEGANVTEGTHQPFGVNSEVTSHTSIQARASDRFAQRSSGANLALTADFPLSAQAGARGSGAPGL